MNENLKKLRDLVASADGRVVEGHILFSMTTWSSSVPEGIDAEADYFARELEKVPSHCGTIMCLGGLCEDVLGMPEQTELKAPLLGLPEDVVDNLFCPLGIKWEDWGILTPTQAVQAIDNAAAGQHDPWKGVAYD